MKKYVLIVAGGAGKRMGAEAPKQFLELEGKPIIVHTINKFQETLPDANIILVLPLAEKDRWGLIAQKFRLEQIAMAIGGANRFESVKSGLSSIKEDEALVAIHDGVRPLVSADTIIRVFNEAEKSGASIPTIKLSESIRKVNIDGSKAVNREDYRIVQTPQCFLFSLIKEAYQQDYHTSYTDDASVIESYGASISQVEGNIENIKITHPVDLRIASVLLKGDN